MKLMDWHSTKTRLTVALVAPFVCSVLIQVPLSVREVSRFVAANTNLYSFFILLAVLSFLPSAFIIGRSMSGNRARSILIAAILMVLYAPLLWIEFFYTQCYLFGECHLL
jgi:hypothetical protein